MRLLCAALLCSLLIGCGEKPRPVEKPACPPPVEKPCCKDDGPNPCRCPHSCWCDEGGDCFCQDGTTCAKSGCKCRKAK